jgi:rubrerythrin
MPRFFAASEVLEFAIRIEENGEAFYRAIAKKIKTAKIKELFNYLADEEVKHRRIFTDMLSKIEKYEPAESFPGEYFLYLRAYADEHVFTKAKTGALMARKINTAKGAVGFALGIELDSILYYMEAKNLVPEHQRQVIDGIADEERHHYLKLLEIKKGL